MLCPDKHRKVLSECDKTKILHLMCTVFRYLLDVQQLAQLRLSEDQDGTYYTDEEVE